MEPSANQSLPVPNPVVPQGQQETPELKEVTLPSLQAVEENEAAAAVTTNTATTSSTQITEIKMDNPLLKIKFEIPFDQVKAEHIEPAIASLIAESQKNVDKVCEPKPVRTFENTMLALEKATENSVRRTTRFRSRSANFTPVWYCRSRCGMPSRISLPQRKLRNSRVPTKGSCRRPSRISSAMVRTCRPKESSDSQLSMWNSIILPPSFRTTCSMPPKHSR
jgi:hypothetical protein